jgi:crossover junction endodeoxyribonuclease RuvC
MSLPLTLGVDPGKTGALALLDPDGHLVDVIDMPAATGAALGALLRHELEAHAPHRIAVAYVEQVGSRPGQGHMNVWTFAEGYGAILGALGALGVPVHLVTTPTWRRTNRITIPASTPKAQKSKVGKTLSRQRAVELWPTEAGRFARVKDDGRAEAALIARHGLFCAEGRGLAA